MDGDYRLGGPVGVATARAGVQNVLGRSCDGDCDAGETCHNGWCRVACAHDDHQACRDHFGMDSNVFCHDNGNDDFCWFHAYFNNRMLVNAWNRFRLHVGWEHLHINLIHHLVSAVATNQPVEPYGATLEDGYKAAVIAEAIEESSGTGRKVDLDYGL